MTEYIKLEKGWLDRQIDSAIKSREERPEWWKQIEERYKNESN